MNYLSYLSHRFPQELRDKDEQLLQFQRELEQLIQLLGRQGLT